MQCVVTGRKIIFRDSDGMHLFVKDDHVDVPVGVYQREWRNLRPLPVQEETGERETQIPITEDLLDQVKGDFPHEDTQLDVAVAATRWQLRKKKAEKTEPIEAEG